MIGPRAQERVTPEATAGCCSFFVSLSVDIGETRVGKHFLEGGGGGWECVILIVTPPPLFFFSLKRQKRPIFCRSVFFSQAWEGCIHSHWVLIMCQTIMSQSLASHVRKLALPPLPCYSMQMEKKKKEKGWSLRTRSYGAEPGYCPVAKWMASISFYWGGGSGCELEQCSMGNKLGIKEKSLVVVVVRGFGTQKELMFFFVFLNSWKLQNVVRVSYAVFHLMNLCVPALKIAQWEYIMRAAVNSVGWQKLENITRTRNRRFTVGTVLSGHWCFLFPLARTLVKKQLRQGEKK